MNDLDLLGIVLQWFALDHLVKMVGELREHNRSIIDPQILHHKIPCGCKTPSYPELAYASTSLHSSPHPPWRRKTESDG